jgi:hypothetical protein
VSYLKDKQLQGPIETCLQLLGRYGHFTSILFPEIKRALLLDTSDRAATLTVLRLVYRGAPPALTLQPLQETIDLLLTEAFCCTHETDVFVAIVVYFFSVCAGAGHRTTK